jgi:hypothetical protein
MAHQTGIRGKLHRLTVFRVIERDEFGRPTTCELIPDEKSVKIENGMEFFTAWVPAVMLTDRRSKAKA